MLNGNRDAGYPLRIKFYYILGQPLAAQSNCNTQKREAAKLLLSAATIDGSHFFHLLLLPHRLR